MSVAVAVRCALVHTRTTRVLPHLCRLLFFFLLFLSAALFPKNRGNPCILRFSFSLHVKIPCISVYGIHCWLYKAFKRATRLSVETIRCFQNNTHSLAVSKRQKHLLGVSMSIDHQNEAKESKIHIHNRNRVYF